MFYLEIYFTSYAIAYISIINKLRTKLERHIHVGPRGSNITWNGQHFPPAVQHLVYQSTSCLPVNILFIGTAQSKHRKCKTPLKHRNM